MGERARTSEETGRGGEGSGEAVCPFLILPRSARGLCSQAEPVPEPVYKLHKNEKTRRLR